MLFLNRMSAQFFCGIADDDIHVYIIDGLIHIRIMSILCCMVTAKKKRISCNEREPNLKLRLQFQLELLILLLFFSSLCRHHQNQSTTRYNFSEERSKINIYR